MKSVSKELQKLYDDARTYAALHDAFRPADALIWANDGTTPEDPQDVARALAMLSPDCGRLPAEHPDPPLWSMRPAARRKLLEIDLLAKTKEVKFNTPITDALRGKGDYAPANLSRLLDEGGDLSRIAAITGTLDRAGPRARGYKHLVALRGLLNRLRAEKRTDSILGKSFAGRQAELNRIARGIARPQSKPPLRAMYISGMAGIGKSFLMEQAVQNARLKHIPIFVRLDFDRSGLNVLDQESFIDEISRQVGDGLPEMAKKLRELRLKVAGKDAPVTDSKATEPQETLIETLANAVRASGRTLLVILDTLEVLRSTGETRIEVLFEKLDLLTRAGIDKISIIAAGRGNALEPAPHRLRGKPLALTGLPDSAAREFLRGHNVSEKLWPKVIKLARGNPLFLLLTAQSVTQTWFDESKFSADVPDDDVGGYLYNAVLSRLPTPLNQVAANALLLGSVTPEYLLKIIAPVAAPKLTEAQAEEAFALMKQQDWLVLTDQAATELQHRMSVRRAFLPILYDADPDTTAAINRRALECFKDDTFEHLYHSLQLVRAGEAVPKDQDIKTELALRFDEFMLEELPPQARDAVRHAQGRRSDYGRAGDTTITAHPDQRAVDDLDLLLKKGDLREAGFVIDHALQGVTDPEGPVALLMLCHQWLTGRWSAAQKLFATIPTGKLEDAVEKSPLLQGRVLLEIHAEYEFDTLVEFLRDPAFLKRALECHAQSARIGMEGAALDFALTIALSETAKPPRLNLARGILAHNGLEDWQSRQRAREMVQSRRHRHGLKSNSTSAASHSVGLASLSPFGPRIQAFLNAHVGTRTGIWLRKAQSLPRAAANHYAPALQAVDQALPTRFLTATDVAAGFDLLGLSAEWATGFTALHRVPDFPSLARAADRWRRATAGEWCWGQTRPPYWVGTEGGPDRVTLDRAKRLMLAANPASAAADQLLFWASPTLSGKKAAAQLVTRYGNRTDQARSTGTLPATLNHLIHNDVPPLIAASLAVLATTKTRLKDAFTAT
ncbi:ATP-binding protein [uncultured Roseovarius sp.]|uniref:ATP-binding protein n=1 Tax=uncultured Roseovarius sp. TaxID=293344 RepID=UPI00260E3159|nr:ATP-binding protein [uncultured Roseovarius sp.]